MAGGGVVVALIVLAVVLVTGGSSKKNAGTPAASVASATAADASVQRHGTLTLKEGYSALLSTAKPDWQLQSGCDDNCELLLRFGSLTSGFDYGDLAALPSATTADLQSCRTATDYVKGLSPTSLAVGARVCVRTASSQYALLKVTNVAATPTDLQSLTFDVTVWK